LSDGDRFVQQGIFSRSAAIKPQIHRKTLEYRDFARLKRGKWRVYIREFLPWNREFLAHIREYFGARERELNGASARQLETEELLDGEGQTEFLVPGLFRVPSGAAFQFHDQSQG